MKPAHLHQRKRPAPRWLFTFLIGLFCVSGCEAIRSSMDYSTPCNSVGIFGKHYFLKMGYGGKDWIGTYGREKDKAIVSHLPTRSEFAIYFSESSDGKSSPRDKMLAIAQGLELEAKAAQDSEKWETTNYEIIRRVGDQKVKENIQIE